jgi:hypothetical protein
MVHGLSCGPLWQGDSSYGWLFDTSGHSLTLGLTASGGMGGLAFVVVGFVLVLLLSS